MTVMDNQIYDNFFLANEVEDQFNSHLDLTRFATIDNSLVGTAGMVKKINKYSATAGTQKLKMGEGNSKSIEVRLSDSEYRIGMAQNRFEYYDEQAMTDPNLVPVGTRHMGTDMYNTVNDEVFAEFRKTPTTLEVERFDFDAFVDAGALLNLENLEGVEKFAFVCPLDVAEIRKNCKETYQYVKDYATHGYVGTLGDVNLYTKKDAVKGEIIMGTRGAVTIFNKKGTEIEQITKNVRSEEAANKRLNTIFSRKYYLVALTDESKAVKITKNTDTSLESLTLGSLELTPAFAPGVLKYTAETTNATNTITAVASDKTATVTIKNGETSVNSGSAATWKEGVNSVTIEVANATDNKIKTVYTVQVTKKTE